MYETIIAKLGTSLGNVDLIKEAFNYPKTKIDKYPAAFYFPSGFENTFETGQENYHIYRFRITLIVGTEQTTMQEATSVLTKVVQQTIAQLDADWNQSTIDGHRVWVKVDSGDEWEVSEEQDGVQIYANLNVEFRLLSDI